MVFWSNITSSVILVGYSGGIHFYGLAIAIFCLTFQVCPGNIFCDVCHLLDLQCESKNPRTLRPMVFWHFWQTVENFKSIFTHLLYVPI